MKKKKAVDEKGLPANLSAPDSEVHPGTGKRGCGGQEVQNTARGGSIVAKFSILVK